jgi:excisionase family DNA binding protein
LLNLIRIKEAAELVNLSETTIKRRIADGTIRAYQVGKGCILIDPVELVEDIKSRPVLTDQPVQKRYRRRAGITHLEFNR